MNNTPTADTRSPWYETFAATAAGQTRWLEGTRFPAPQLEAEQAVGGGDEAPEATEDQWVTEALFELYNA